MALAADGSGPVDEPGRGVVLFTFGGDSDGNELHQVPAEALREFVDVLLGRYDVVQEPAAVERLPLSDLLQHYVQ